MRMGRLVFRANPWLLAIALLLPVSAYSQKPPKPEEKKPQPLSEGLPKRELSKKEQTRREKALRKELEAHYKKWLEEDVSYIILPEEREAFRHLNTDEEREQFSEQFWLRRDPTPDSIENEYKEEHYRRIAYTNERFASGIPGWKTDRGRIYIMWGPPDEIEAYPAGGMYDRLPEEGGGSTSVFPFERWRYRYLEGIGTDIILEFVDVTGSGEYRLTMDPSEKDALTLIPGAGLSWMEQTGQASKLDRFTRSDGTRLPASSFEPARMQAFERLALFAAVQKPPPVKFKDLEALVETRISFNLLPFRVRADFFRVTGDTILVPITIGVQKKDLTFRLQDGLHQATVNVFARIHTLTGRPVQTFEDVIQLDIPPALFRDALQRPAVYQKAVPLRPGLYKLNVVLKDLNSSNVGTIEQRLAVPRYGAEELAHSSLILADLIERVPLKQVGTGQFVFGQTKVRPAVTEEFMQQERMGIYLQVYNLGINEQTHKPDATIEYEVLQGEKTIFQHSENTSDLARAGQQITLEKILPLQRFAPGEYKLQVKVTDRVRNQTVSPAARFRIVR
ncbi:MAG: GWxTD domain-containing protein [Terriglobia bacterium]